MDRRPTAQSILEGVLGSANVYFQPPKSIAMRYPAIVYGLKKVKTHYKDNRPYVCHRQYSVTLIDRDPDSIYVSSLAMLPTASFNRFFVSDNLNHWVFDIYF